MLTLGTAALRSLDLVGAATPHLQKLAAAGANLAVPSRDWSSRRIVRELRPLVTTTCDDISAILGFAG